MQQPVKPESKPRRMLSEVVHEKLRAGHYSRRTEETYLGWIRRFLRFHRGKAETLKAETLKAEIQKAETGGGGIPGNLARPKLWRSSIIWLIWSVWRRGRKIKL